MGLSGPTRLQSCIPAFARPHFRREERTVWLENLTRVSYSDKEATRPLGRVISGQVRDQFSGAPRSRPVGGESVVYPVNIETKTN